MAARRLIIVLAVLFGLSIGAAAIAPDRNSLLTEDESSTTTSTTTGPTTSPVEPEAPEPANGETAQVDILASTEQPETVTAGVGDQLQLNVSVKGGGQVEIAPLGLLETAGSNAPATFNLLLRENGALPITDAKRGDLIGRILVGEPDSGGAPGGPSTEPSGKEEPKRDVGG